MSAPQVYRAITAISAELAPLGIAKVHRNERDDYLYRSIDDVLNRLAPLLARHKLCVLPRVLDRITADRTGDGDVLLVHVALRVAFDLVSSADGSSHTVEAFGEAVDPSDKATAKAMSSAYKYAMLQAFCVPVTQIDDADRSTHRLRRREHPREPVEGWQQWAAGIADIARSCATADALDRLQSRQRQLLTAIARERPDLYATLGEAFGDRARELKRIDGAVLEQNGEPCANSVTGESGEGCAKSVASETGEECTELGPPPNGERCATTESEPLRQRRSPSKLRKKPSQTRKPVKPVGATVCALPNGRAKKRVGDPAP
jgi:hypothetical protein